jgi:outer membrane lipoprotein-sorting protein
VLVAFLRRISTRHLVLLCTGVVAAAVGATALAIAATSGGPTPPAKPLAVALRDALRAPAPPGVTARIRFTNHLIDSSGIQGANPVLTGATGRLWASSDGRLRIELQSERGDAQFVSDRRRFWAYDGSSNTVYRGTLPQRRGERAHRAHRLPTLVQIQRAITRLGRRVSLSGAIPSDVAGRAAYTLRAAPRRAGGLLGGIAVAWDAARGVPLRFGIYARGQSDPVLKLEVTDISYGKVPAGDFAVSPPSGVKTVDLTSHRARTHAEKRSALGFKPVAPRSLAGRPRSQVRILRAGALVTYGRGLDGIAVLEQRGAAVTRTQLPTVTIGAVKGQELQTPLGTLIRFQRGGLTYTVVGSVTRQVAEAAARGL